MPSTITELDMPERRAQEVRLSDETIAYLESRIAEGVRKGMSSGLSDAITEEAAGKIMKTFITAVQKNANDHAGRVVLGGLWGMTKRAAGFVLMGSLVYAVGGWSAIAGMAKVVFAGGVK